MDQLSGTEVEDRREESSARDGGPGGLGACCAGAALVGLIEWSRGVELVAEE